MFGIILDGGEPVNKGGVTLEIEGADPGDLVSELQKKLRSEAGLPPEPELRLDR